MLFRHSLSKNNARCMTATFDHFPAREGEAAPEVGVILSPTQDLSASVTIAGVRWVWHTDKTTDHNYRGQYLVITHTKTEFVAFTGNCPKLRDSVGEFVRRLGTDYIDDATRASVLVRLVANAADGKAPPPFAEALQVLLAITPR